MIGRVVLAALLAGIAAGFIMGAIQHVRLTPFILAAETYETAGAAGHSHDHAAPTDRRAGRQPRRRRPRPRRRAGPRPTAGSARLATTLTAVDDGRGLRRRSGRQFRCISGLPITRQNGMVWGLCGFLAVTLAPAVGLPPELPGMPAGDLVARQVWWVGTIAATGCRHLPDRHAGRGLGAGAGHRADRPSPHHRRTRSRSRTKAPCRRALPPPSPPTPSPPTPSSGC